MSVEMKSSPLFPLATYRYLFAAIAAIWFIGFVIAVLAPVGVLSDYWIAKAFVSMMQIDHKGVTERYSKSSFPEISSLYYSVTWLSFPFWFLISWKWANSRIGVDKTGILFKNKLSILNRLCLLLVLPIWLFLAYAGLNLNHGGDTRIIMLGSSRIQLGLFGMGVPCASALLLMMALFSIKRVVFFEKIQEK